MMKKVLEEQLFQPLFPLRTSKEFELEALQSQVFFLDPAQERNSVTQGVTKGV